MTEEEKLDYILEKLKPRGSFILSTYTTKLLGDKIRQDDIHSYMKSLEGDGNVEIQILPQAYRITSKGEMFIGYEKTKRNKNFWKWVTRVGIIIGAITGILSILISGGIVECSQGKQKESPNSHQYHQSKPIKGNCQKSDSTNND